MWLIAFLCRFSVVIRHTAGDKWGCFLFECWNISNNKRFKQYRYISINYYLGSKDNFAGEGKFLTLGNADCPQWLVVG